jgi:hypothetical protein
VVDTNLDYGRQMADGRPTEKKFSLKIIFLSIKSFNSSRTSIKKNWIFGARLKYYRKEKVKLKNEKQKMENKKQEMKNEKLENGK